MVERISCCLAGVSLATMGSLAGLQQRPHKNCGPHMARGRSTLAKGSQARRRGCRGGSGRRLGVAVAAAAGSGGGGPKLNL